MKTLALFLILMMVFGMTITTYYYEDDMETLKRGKNKFLGRDCELKPLVDGWTQIENCAVYKFKGFNK